MEKKNTRETSKSDENRKRSPMSKTTTTSHSYFIVSTLQQHCNTVRVNMSPVLFFSFFFSRKERDLLPLCIQFSICASMQEPKELEIMPSSLCRRLV